MRRIASLSLLLVLSPCVIACSTKSRNAEFQSSATASAPPGYAEEIAKWRKDYDRELMSEKGPLFLITRDNLPEGISEVGSAPSSRVKLPDRAPKHVGNIERRGNEITFRPARGVAVNLNGKPLRGAALLRVGVAPAPRDAIQFGDFEIRVSGSQLIARDQQSSYRKAFKGAAWFPMNTGYRVEGAFISYPEPKNIKVPDTTGRDRQMKVPGYVTFQLDGKTQRLEPVFADDDKILFFMFKDSTSGHETYGAGRFLDTELPKGGKVLLDFNKAYNPYCAVNPYSSCPIPPKQNKMSIRVEAGEIYHGDH